MNRERYQRVRTILEQARAEPRDRRRQVIIELCDDDTSLQRDALELMEGLEDTSGFLATPALGDSFRVAHPSGSHSQSGASAARPSGPLPKRVGRYAVSRLIAEGGMGTVYEATQDHPQRTVALKTLRAGVLRADSLRRFELEVRVLARLQHPAIAQIYDAGSAPIIYDDNQNPGSAPVVPYFAMELICGSPVTEFIVARDYSIEQRIGLMIEIADAVHHGHQKGVIHRDLKPGNLMVDEAGRPRIIDFGVARATDADLSIIASETQQGQLIGTLRYMSPEQCTGDPDAVDLRSDIYSLGVVLYEMLSGELPYGDRTSSVFDLPRIIRETPPRSLAGMNSSLRGDLDTIVGKALEKDAGRRYQSAHEFAADLRRFVAREPIAARPPSAMYQLRMFARRNRTLVAGAVVATLMLVAGVIGTSIGLVHAIEAQRDANEARDVADRRRELAEFESYAANIAAAESAIRAGRIADAERRLSRTPTHLRGWEWRHLTTRLDRSQRILRGHSGLISDVAFSRDGSLLGSAGGFDRTLRLWNVSSGEQLMYLELERGGYIRMAVTPDDQFVAVGTSRDGEVHLHRIEDGQIVRTFSGHRSGVEALTISPDGSLLASGSSDRTVRIWNLSTGQLLHTLPGHTSHVSALAFSPDGTRLLSGSWDQTAIIWDTLTGNRLHTLAEHAGRIYAAAWSPDDSYLVTGADDSQVRVWDAATGAPMTVFRRHDSELRAVALSPDGSQVASTGVDSVIYRWNPRTGALVGAMNGHRDAVRALAWSSDGSMIASGGADRTIRLWNAQTADVLNADQANRWLFDVEFAENGQTAWICGTHAILRRLDAATGQAIQDITAQRLPALGVAVSPDNRRIISGGDDRTVQVFDSRTGECLARLPGHGGVIRDVAIHPDGDRLASVSIDQTVRIWDAHTYEILHTVALDQQTWSALYEPGGARLFVGLRNGEVVVFEASSMRQLHRFRAHGGAIRRMDIHPSSALLATTGADGGVAIWNADSFELIGRMSGHAGPVNGVAFSRDGTRLATGGDDQLIRIWDVARRREVATLHGHNNLIFSIAFAPDDSRLISVGTASAVRIWDAPAVAHE